MQNGVINEQERKRIRLAVFLFYFSMGLMFASWASRIPDIKTKLGLSDAALGSILLALPMAQMLMVTFSGKIVAKFSSRKVALIALPLYSICLSNIGLVQAGWQLAIALFLFGIAGNLCNISVNTQGVMAERLYDRPIMASFHGSWSLAGFTGSLVGMLMISLKIIPYFHFLIVIFLVWIVIYLNHSFLIGGNPVSGEEETRRKFFNKPDQALVQLGIIGFCSMASEGAMFDWSGVYFKDVVHAPASLVVLGYSSFMIMMASGRFLADWLIRKIGRMRLMQICGLMITAGFYTAILLPNVITAAIGFMVVGLGVSSMVPSVYSAAGNHTGIPPSIALATVASISYFGFLMGPPLIGYISEAAGLKYSFAVIGIFGLGISLLVSKIRLLNS